MVTLQLCRLEFWKTTMDFTRKNINRVLKLFVPVIFVVFVYLSVRMEIYGHKFVPVPLFHIWNRTVTHLEIPLKHNENQTNMSEIKSILAYATHKRRFLKRGMNMSGVSKNDMDFHRISECFKSTLSEKSSMPLVFQNDSSKHKFECKHLMYLGRLNNGRTGNQLFQLASLLGIASYHDYLALVSSSMSVAKIFNLPNLSNTKVENVKTFGEKACCSYNKNVEDLDHASNWTLMGYFQSLRYFKRIEGVIKREFTIKDTFVHDARKFIYATVSLETINVCIHIRRGDFLKLRKIGYSEAPVGYIQTAINYFRKKYQTVHFFVVSDDKAWCKTNLKWPNITISPFSSEGHDMALMIESDHVIITSGTFGWWGAWLSGGETVYWTGYLSDSTSVVGRNFEPTDYYPEQWVGLS